MLPRCAVMPFVFPVVLALAGCKSNRAIVIMMPTDAAVEVGRDSLAPDSADTTPARETGPDVPGDTATDPTPDVPTDPAPDAATDPSPDAPTDRTPDTSTDAAPDTPTDSSPDAATDPAPDASKDTAPDAATDPAPDKATDPAMEPANPGLLFYDEFTDGHGRWLPPSDNDGVVSKAFDGKNAIVTFDSSSDSFTRLRCNVDGSLFSITDITASMRFRVEQAAASSRVRLDVRQAAATENIFYAVGAVVDDSGLITKAGIYKKVPTDEPNYTICALAETKLDPPLPIGQWHALKLTVSGYSPARLAAYFDDAPVANYVDDCVSTLTATNGNAVANGGCLSGQTGLGIQVEEGVIASVDDVLVTTP